MIYIVGFTFKFDGRITTRPSGISVQEQIALAKHRGMPVKPSSIFDERFIAGNTYKVSCIQRAKDVTKIRYLFSNLTDTTLPDIDIDFKDTGAGDNYIAMLSGKTRELNELRNSIMESNTLNSDH